MATVGLQGVKKRYGESAVIHGIDLEIADREFVVLVGPSGCGKSTLLRMVAGLEEVSEGQISIAGKRVNDLPARDRDIAMVFQSYALYPHMTVAENMGFALRLAKRPPEEIAHRVARAAGMLGLTDLLARHPRALSGGQRQRVAMGRAIVRNPQVFLFDEPLSNLDAQLRVQMRTDIKALHQEIATTSIYVTHDQIEAMTLADRIVVLNGGRIEQVGSPLELYDRPANRFVASFIGSPAMNLLPAALQHGATSTAVTLADGQSLPLCDGLFGEAGQPVWLGIRPEHLHIAESGGIATTVRVMELTGAETHLLCKCGAADISAVVAERLRAAPGDRLHLAPQAPNVHLFDRASGLRLDWQQKVA